MLRQAKSSYFFVCSLCHLETWSRYTLPRCSHADSGYSDQQNVLDDTSEDGFDDGKLLFVVEINFFDQRLMCSNHHE
jgi:hypothetical protein